MIVASEAFNAANTKLVKKPIYIIEIDGYQYAFSNGVEDETGVMHFIQNLRNANSVGQE
jgi:hypothetical protein